jgi:threonine synthase
LVCASNANNVLTDFIQTGTYDRRRPLHKTDSPSMDILVSSNLERLLYFLSGDTELVAGLMKDLNKDGFYTVPETLKKAISEEFWAGYCDDDRAAKTIRDVFENQKYLCDTHTATGWAVAEDYVNQTGDNSPMVVLSTASAYKFPAAVLSALEDNNDPDEFDKMDRLCAVSGVKIPENLVSVRYKKELHTDVIAKEDMLGRILYL